MTQKIAVIIGSTRPGRVGDKVAEWYVSHLTDVKDAQFDIIDLAEVNLPLLDEAIPPLAGQYQQEHTKKWAEQIGSYDAFVWVTAEYNHAAPASLTNAISFISKEWNNKPVALVSYGSIGGVRAAENLRLIAGELHLVDIQPTVMILEPWAMFEEGGSIKPELVKGDVMAQIEKLLWWSKVLQSARQEVAS
jgi:NAD(P)H-dependent FMN reductase